MIDQGTRNRLQDLVTLIDDFDEATDKDGYTDTRIAWDKFNQIREVLKGILGTDEDGASSAQQASEDPAVGEAEEPQEDGPVYRYLDMSTSHLSLEMSATIDSLTSGSEPSYPVLAVGRYGWLLSVPDADGDPEDPDDYACLDPLFRRARELGCVKILLDQDAMLIEGLPTYEEE